MGVSYTREDISIAHRLSRPNNENHSAPAIVVQFVSRSVRAEWLSAAKKRKILTTDLSPSLQPAPVYINEHLSAHNKQLLGRAKSLVREKKLAYAWVNDGRVLVRKTADSQAERVRDFGEIDRAVLGHQSSPSDDSK